MEWAVGGVAGSYVRNLRRVLGGLRTESRDHAIHPTSTSQALLAAIMPACGGNDIADSVAVAPHNSCPP